MGADGGVCWLKLLDRKRFFELTDFLHWRLLNISQGEYQADSNNQYVTDEEIADNAPDERSGDWIQGYYGTDCNADLEDLIILIRSISTEDSYLWSVNGEDIRDYNILELREALITDPYFDCWSNERLSYCSANLGWKNISFLFDVFVDHLQTTIHRRDGYISTIDLGFFPESLHNTTLREWAQQVSETIDMDSYYSMETWT